MCYETATVTDYKRQCRTEPSCLCIINLKTCAVTIGLQQADVENNATLRQLAFGRASCDDYSVQAAEADLHCSSEYLLEAQRHSSETPWSSLAAQLWPLGTRPGRRSLPQVLPLTADYTWQLLVHSQSLRAPAVHHRQRQHYSDDRDWKWCRFLWN